MPRESTQELDLALDVEWEVPATPVARVPPKPPAPPPLKKAARNEGGLRGRLQKLLDFALWERVALVRFGVGDSRPDRLAFEAVAHLAHQIRTPPSGPEELEAMRRNYSRVVEMIVRNRKSLDEALRTLSHKLGMDSPQER